jgi:predicted transcriptional regulator of viral defense system
LCYNVYIKKKTADILYSIAKQHYGVVTVSDAKNAGLTPDTVRQFAKKNDTLVNWSKGVYTFYDDPEDVIDWTLTDLYRATRIGGENAFLFGESVLSLFDLARVCPKKHTVAVPRYYSKMKMKNVHRIYYRPVHRDEVTTVGGIRIQNLKYAFLNAHRDYKNNLLDGARQALGQELLTETDYNYVTTRLNEWK